MWKNTDDNTVVGNSVNVSLLKAGNYQLTATNQYNCSVTSPVISIPLAAFAAITPANPVASNAACGQNNGVIKLDGFTNANALASYQWIKGVTNESLGSQMSITGLGEGNYKLIATDTNGCVKTIYSADITVGAKPQIDKSDIQVVNDRCSLKEASINGLQIRGSSNTPTYTWTDGNGMLVSTSLDIKNIGEGNYQLTVKDGAFCVITGETIHVTNDNSDPLPQYDDLIIPRNTATTLKVNNSSEGTYFLYADPAGNQLIEENTTGIFNTPVLNADRIFYVKHINGGCVSQAKQIKITVVDKSEFAVPTAFTPNRDGLNEVLHVKVLGYINLEYFRIFNRFGKEVFFSKKLTDGWDGRVNGREQPSGVFIWMARGKDLLGNTVESKGTIMLIR